MQNKVSLYEINPVLAEEWNHEKNGDLLPSMVSVGSNKKVWWKCKKCGYEWQAVIYSRQQGNGCPYCSGRVVWKGHNDLKTKNPVLAEEDSSNPCSGRLNAKKQDKSPAKNRGAF